jgi:L-seryl-tRNA(Ser) seleniumtransferase
LRTVEHVLAPGSGYSRLVTHVESDLRRRIPSVDQLLQRPEVRALGDAHGRDAVLRHLRAALDELRETAAAGDAAAVHARLDALPVELARRLEAAAAPSLVGVINATGVVVHTNLGRAPLSRAAAERVAAIASSYSNLEFDLEDGARGQREIHAEGRIRRLLGSEASVVVNNNAAAVMLAVNTLADGGEVLVSRGELVEIGGSFRIPDVLRKGGARLREVGTTNRTRLSDYEAVLSRETAMILKVHPSNFRLVGFTEAPDLAALAQLARAADVPLVEDLGSGYLTTLPGALAGEASVGASLRAGVDLVTFSGDKLLGGPQAGLIVGRRDLCDELRTNPLYRALRVDKLTLAALDAVLGEHEAGRALESVPVLRMLAAGADEIRARAATLAAALRAAVGGVQADVVAGESAVGGGAAPTVGVPTWLVAVSHRAWSAERLASALRAARPPVVARVADARLLLDLRTVRAGEEPALRAALVGVLGGGGSAGA